MLHNHDQKLNSVPDLDLFHFSTYLLLQFMRRPCERLDPPLELFLWPWGDHDVIRMRLMSLMSQTHSRPTQDETRTEPGSNTASDREDEITVKAKGADLGLSRAAGARILWEVARAHSCTIRVYSIDLMETHVHSPEVFRSLQFDIVLSAPSVSLSSLDDVETSVVRAWLTLRLVVGPVPPVPDLV